LNHMDWILSQFLADRTNRILRIRIVFHRFPEESDEKQTANGRRKLSIM
jgi:hypothetical protein